METEGELARLQEILYGNQARVTDRRLSDLEQRLEAVRQELSDSVNARFGKLETSTQENLSKARRALSDEIERLGQRQGADLVSTQGEFNDRLTRQDQAQTAQLRAAQRELMDAIDALRQDLVAQIHAAKTELSERLERLGADQTGRLLAAQNEARQRDEALRQEMLALSSWLDDKKTSRHDLGKMLMDMGQNLRGLNDATESE
ncbi:MAG: hypothetical protein KC418_06860 [Anaerolineales bacterium]|nr:hypothetical protein [Anaerolineales bacterium]MCB8951698.1 hypothetical protein [Ardenticatenales bacterium]